MSDVTRLIERLDELAANELDSELLFPNALHHAYATLRAAALAHIDGERQRGTGYEVAAQWRDRALAAEGKLASMMKTLGIDGVQINVAQK